MARSRRSRDCFTCPHCGADVPVGAPACRECGSDAETGWSEDADVWSADIPTGYDEEDEFDYEGFVAREFGGPRSVYGWKKIAAIVIAIAVCLGVLLWSLVC